MAPQYVRDPSSWPLLLVGPMVRRVTASSASVFVATKEAANVDVRLYRAPTGGESFVHWGGSTRPIGARLHVLVAEHNQLSLEPGTVYYYDLSISPKTGSGAQDLDSLGLLAGEVPLGYTPGHRPSFVLPMAEPDLRIVHGSCRKPHGGGPDMLSAVDTLIADAVGSPAERPQQLFLTGDQIYADDVAPGMLLAVGEAGTLLLGWANDEKMPINLAGEVFPRDHFRFQPGWRSQYLDDHGVKPSTHYADNHLLFLGDWLGMYVMCWSDAIWARPNPSTHPGWAHSYWLPVGEEVPVFPPPAKAALELTVGGYVEAVDVQLDSWLAFADMADDYIEEAGVVTRGLGSLVQGYDKVQAMYRKVRDSRTKDMATPKALDYAERLPYIRRALANVATYMMFDDHEVTDDWYLNLLVDRRLRRTGAGRRLMRNGLIAYAIFQDWGNRAAKDADINTILGALDTSAGDPPISQSGQREMLDDMFGIRSDLDPRVSFTRTPSKRWDFWVEGPSHRALVLDTRTRRALPGFHLVKAVGLAEFNAGMVELAAQIQQVDQALVGLRAGQRVIVVSPAPVIGMDFVELFQKLMIFRAPEEGGTETYDNDLWSGNATCYAAFLRRLVAHEPVVFLSGDVHYAYTNIADFQDKAGLQARFVQLTSSSSKNSDAITAALSISELVTNPLMKGEVRVACEELRDLLVQQPEMRDRVLEMAVEILNDKVAGLPSLKSLAWSKGVEFVKSLPSLVFEKMFPVTAPYLWTGLNVMEQIQLGAVRLDQVQQILRAKDLGHLLDEDYWAIQVETLLDERAEAQVAAALHADLTRELDSLPSDSRQGALRRNHGSVGDTNVGVVTFPEPNIVRHELLWRHKPTPLRPGQRPMTTLHDADLRFGVWQSSGSGGSGGGGP